MFGKSFQVRGIRTYLSYLLDDVEVGNTLGSLPCLSEENLAQDRS